MKGAAARSQVDDDFVGVGVRTNPCRHHAFSLAAQAHLVLVTVTYVLCFTANFRHSRAGSLPPQAEPVRLSFMMTQSASIPEQGGHT